MPNAWNKKLVVCLDGTYNEALRVKKASSIPYEARNWTNVAKIAFLVDERGKIGQQKVSQVTSYFRGVGSGSRDYERFLDGVHGSGLDYQILDAYLFLSNNYVPGDEVFLIGYSRGAAAARALAGFIEVCGLLKGSHADFRSLRIIWKQFLGRFSRKAAGLSDHEYWAKHGYLVHNNVEIKALGLWDTVFGGFQFVLEDTSWSVRFEMLSRGVARFVDRKLASNVRNAFHAMAFDEYRNAFTCEPIRGYRKPEKGPAPLIEQVWFAGSHGNVGGGCRDEGFADISLKWMIDRLKSAGLSFHDDRKFKSPVTPSLTGVLYDSTKANFTGFASNGSLKKHVRPVSFHHKAGDVDGEKVHSSVLALWGAKVKLTDERPGTKPVVAAYPLKIGQDERKLFQKKHDDHGYGVLLSKEKVADAHLLKGYRAALKSAHTTIELV